MRRIIFLFIGLINSYSGLCQSPDFNVPSNLCLSGVLTIENTSLNSTKYVWDFCNSDLGTSPAYKSTRVVTGSELPIDIQVEYSEGEWLGFSVDFLRNKLYRLSYGSSLDLIPSINEAILTL